MKRIITITLLAIFTVFLLYSCRNLFLDSEPESEPKPPQNEMTHQELELMAKSWLEYNKDPRLTKTLPDSINVDGGIIFRPYWNLSSISRKDKYEVYESHIETWGVRNMITQETEEKYKATKDKRYNRSLTKFIYRIDMETGKESAYLMTIIPDLSYIESTNFKPFEKVSYAKRDENFSGYIVYHDLKGKLVNGWQYKSGRITATVTQIPLEVVKLREKFQTKASTCYYTWITETWEMCYYWINQETNEHILSGCRPLGQVSMIWEACYYSEGDDYPSGGGGPADDNTDEAFKKKIDSLKRKLCGELLSRTNSVPIKKGNAPAHDGTTVFMDDGTFLRPVPEAYLAEELFHNCQNQDYNAYISQNDDDLPGRDPINDFYRRGSINKEFEARVYRDLMVLRAYMEKNPNSTDFKLADFTKFTSGQDLTDYIAALYKAFNGDWNDLQNGYDYFLRLFERDLVGKGMITSGTYDNYFARKGLSSLHTAISLFCK